MNFIMDGGPAFMVPLLLMLVIIVILFIRGLRDYTSKIKDLLKEVGLFALVFGVLGFVIGLLGALTDIANANDISHQVLAIGFKVGFMAPTFGMIIFLIGKLFSIILISTKK